MENRNQTVRLKVPPGVARILAKNSPRELQLTAARGEVPLPDEELFLTLIFLGNGGDPEIRLTALRTLKKFPPARLVPVVTAGGLDSRILDFIARVRGDDPEIVRALLADPAVSSATLTHLAAQGDDAVLNELISSADPLPPEIIAVIFGNAKAGAELKDRLRKMEAGAAPPLAAGTSMEAEDDAEDDAEDEPPPEEEINLSKYQQALEMGVSAKIKMALTGDKEWRNIFIKDANKLVSSAVLKNPRITDGEVLTVAKNKSSSEELIRLINLNREWTKKYEIRKVLLVHPRTPLPKALRYLSVLGEKDVRSLAKSRNVSQVIVNAARRILMAKQKKKG